jgi:flagellar assembly protein FliH
MRSLYNQAGVGYGYAPERKIRTRVIDSNAIIQEKIDEYNKAFEQLHPQEDKEPQADGDNPGFVAGLGPLEVVEEEPQITPEELLAQARVEADQIVAEAKAKADQLLDQSQKQAGMVLEQAQDEGRRTGEEEGMERARQYLAKEEEKLDERKKEQELEYGKRLDALEPQLVDVVAQVFEEVFQVKMEEDKDVLLYLIRSTLAGIDGTREFVIKVHSSKIVAVEETLDEIRQIIGNGAQIDIVADTSLTEQDCLIETANGMYDCGVQTQLKNLLRQLRLMSLKNS